MALALKTPPDAFPPDAFILASRQRYHYFFDPHLCSRSDNSALASLRRPAQSKAIVTPKLTSKKILGHEQLHRIGAAAAAAAAACRVCHCCLPSATASAESGMKWPDGGNGLHNGTSVSRTILIFGFEVLVLHSIPLHWSICRLLALLFPSVRSPPRSTHTSPLDLADTKNAQDQSTTRSSSPASSRLLRQSRNGIPQAVFSLVSSGSHVSCN